MELYFSKISKLSKDDVFFVEELINSFFPYVNIPAKLISEKINSNNFFLIKSHQKNILTGFAELEFCKDNTARLNAVFVCEAWRGQGIATKLVHSIIHEAKRKKNIHYLFLLVKKSNLAAKSLYKKCGFKFEKTHENEIEGCEIEVYSMNVH